MDVYLYPVPAFANDADVMLIDPSVLLPPVGGGVTPDWFPDDKRRHRVPAVVAESLHRSLLRRYGISEGKRIYGLMREERKGPFQPGAKYDPVRPRRMRKPPAD